MRDTKTYQSEMDLRPVMYSEEVRPRNRWTRA